MTIYNVLGLDPFPWLLVFCCGVVGAAIGPGARFVFWGDTAGGMLVAIRLAFWGMLTGAFVGLCYHMMSDRICRLAA
jgi:hypothetical protein